MPYKFSEYIKNYIEKHPKKPKRSTIPPALYKTHRPVFKDLWERATEVYDVDNGMHGTDSLDLAGARIGGLIEHNLTTINPDPRANGARMFPNACAIRMSYILQNNGVQVPSHGFGATSGGGDKLRYLFRVKDIENFIPHIWGKPNLTLSNLQNGNEIKGKTGVLIFTISGWGDASGHVTLWNGKRCYDSCYFQEDLMAHGQSNVKTSKVQFWEIK